MKLRISISGVNKDIGVDNEHLSFVHSLEQGFAIRDVDAVASAPQFWQRCELSPRLGVAGLKEQSQSRFDQLGHGALPSSSFLAEPRHNGVVDV